VDEVVCVLETEKVTVDVKAPVAGIVTKYLFEVGSDIRKGQALFEMVRALRCLFPPLFCFSFSDVVSFRLIC
jgi:hypothetical protein